MKIANHEDETVSYKTYEKFSFSESIRLVSSDSKIFKFPKILLSFLSRYCEDDHDVVFTPLGSKNLAQIVEILDGINLSGSLDNFNKEIKEKDIAGPAFRMVIENLHRGTPPIPAIELYRRPRPVAQYQE